MVGFQFKCDIQSQSPEDAQAGSVHEPGGAQVGHWSQGLAPGPLDGQEAMVHQFAVNPRPQKGLTAGMKKLSQELCSGQV
ncbi:unnamed protein product [Gadus morhua 'NCC']